MRRPAILVLLVLALIGGWTASPAAAAPQVPASGRISVSSSEAQIDDVSFIEDLTPNGRFVRFTTDAPGVVTGDSNGFRDVFHRSIQIGGTVERVSVDPAGGDLDGDSSGGRITGDAGAVVFETQATEVGAGQDNGVLADVMVRDITTNITTLMSRRPGVVVNGISCDGRITDDRRVAFASETSNLVPGDSNGDEDVFLSGEVCDGQVVNVDLNKGQVPTGLADVILGTPGPDTVNALGGNDRFCGGGGNDVFRGGAGNDRAFGGAGQRHPRGGGRRGPPGRRG